MVPLVGDLALQAMVLVLILADRLLWESRRSLRLTYFLGVRSNLMT